MVKIEPFDAKWVPQVKEMTDQEIGQDYYTESELFHKVRSSKLNGQIASFVLLDENSVVGVRISLPHGRWEIGKGRLLSENQWPHPKDKTAYFQSLFIKKPYQKKGWGRAMSLKSIEVLKMSGTLGVVCHSWVESPNDSSRKYLQSMGFEPICSYPFYWKQVDYQCPICGKPCLCTAEEMYLDLSQGEF